MRQIKFRGYSPARKEWVYGSLLLNATVTFIIGDHGGLDVLPESVGQFTGLHDKNGVEIYEGDVVKCPVSRLNRLVSWINKDARFVLLNSQNLTHWSGIDLSESTVLPPSFTPNEKI